MFEIKIIGVDVYADEKETIANLSALSGYVTNDFTALSLNLGMEYESDILEFSDNSKKNYGTLSKTGSIILYPKVYSNQTTAVSFNTYYPLAAILATNYVYIYCQTYNIEFGLTAEAVNCVINSVKTNKENSGAIKSIEIEYELNGAL